jgi:hypothetical protein
LTVARQRKVTVTLEESDIQAVEQALLDDDAEAALNFLREVVRPQMKKGLKGPQHKPTFEWDSIEDRLPPDREE